MLMFINFPTDFGNNECQKLWTCFVGTLNWGVRNGGGIGESLYEWDLQSEESMWLSRSVIFDLLFFMIVNIILLNIIFGIIIDTFADLRTQKEGVAEDMANNCFICNINRSEFERAKVDYQKHLKYEHNTWNYFRYLLHIKDKDPREYNGVEAYVAQCVKNDWLDWFPVQTATALQENTTDHVSKESEKMSPDADRKAVEMKDINLIIENAVSSNALALHKLQCHLGKHLFFCM